MSKTVFLFPGQGSQFVGMAKDVYANSAPAKEMFKRAEEILDFPLRDYSFEGPEETLKQTQYTQPAIFVHSVVMDRLMKEKGISPTATAGHSLGEYSALVSAGAINFEDGVKLVKIRGELMQVAGEKNPGTMAAIIGMQPDDIEAICKEASESESDLVQPANFNSPGQVVISGHVPAVHRAMALAKEKGARMAKELVVSGAFHSPLMGDALRGLEEALQNVTVETPTVAVYSNVEATATTDPEKIRELLKRQLMSPVRWESILNNMIADGYGDFYEVGPGKVLQGLLKRTNREYVCKPAGTLEDLPN
ncbi:MAG: ACP S-malonyltransferase [Calditrichia bacterium]